MSGKIEGLRERAWQREMEKLGYVGAEHLSEEFVAQRDWFYAGWDAACGDWLSAGWDGDE